MKLIQQESGSAAGGPANPRAGALPPIGALLLSILLSAGIAGCGFLKPDKVTERRFILTALPAGGPAGAAAGSIGLGVGQVKIPAYLSGTGLAVRKGANEIEHLPSAIWAERVDVGVQRVLGANLSSLLSTDRLRLSRWSPDEVSAEVYVSVEQFDVDASGRGVLIARWRILAPGGEQGRSGGSRLSRQGPAPDADAAGAVQILSELVADLSRELAQAIEQQAGQGR